MVDVGLFLSYILIGVSVLIAVGMPLVKSFSDPHSLKKMGVGVGSLLLVFLISYFMASGETSGEVSETSVKLVGAGLTTFYILAIGAIGAIFYTEIKKATE